MTAPTRSPVLGYNHNIRHRGILFHVQTEDSGVENPHIYTHIFQGGVILSSRRLDYDAEAPEETVKALMQAQHRAVLRDLKRGAFDEKIGQYFGDQVDDSAGDEGAEAEEGGTPGPARAASDGEAREADTERVAAEAREADTQRVTAEAREAAREAAVADDTQPVVPPGAGARGSPPTGGIDDTQPVAPPPGVAEAVPGGERDDIGAALDAVRAPTRPGEATENSDAVHGAPEPAAGMAEARTPPPAERPERGRPSTGPRVPHPDDAPGVYSRTRVGREALESPPGAAGREAHRARRSTPINDGRSAPGSGPARARGPSEGTPTPPTGEGGSSRPAAESGPARRPRGEDGAGREGGAAASSVVVSRPSVIVGGSDSGATETSEAPGGGDREVRGGREAEAEGEGRGRRRPNTDKRRREGLFGQDLISEKSLDEVILAYLSEDGSDE